MKLIESKTLGTAQASIEFTSIPQDGTDLVVLVSPRSLRASVFDDLLIEFNSSTSNLSSRWLQGTGSSAGSDSSASAIEMIINADTATSNTFGSVQIYIPNYTSSAAKSVSAESLGETNATTIYMRLVAGLWNNTAAITSLKVYPRNANFATNTVASLYKITKGSDGIVTTSP
jgi:hypothetical protein